MDNVVHMVMDPMVINFPSNTLVKRKSRSIRADGMLKLLVTCIWLGIWVLAGGYQGLFLHPEPGLGSKMGEPKAPLVLTVYGLPESPHHISINHSQLLWPLKMLLGNQFPSMSFEGKPVQWKNLWFDTNKQVSFFMPSPSLFVLFENGTCCLLSSFEFFKISRHNINLSANVKNRTLNYNHG